MPKLSSLLSSPNFVAFICAFSVRTADSMAPFAWWSPTGDSCAMVSTPSRAFAAASFKAFMACSPSLLLMNLRTPVCWMKPAKNFTSYCVKPFCSNAVAAVLPYLLNFNASLGVETPASDM